MKDIKGYEGEYAVTSCGRVWSYKSKKFLKPRKQRDGYYLINLCHNSIMKTFQLHRLVAEAYLLNPDNLPCVNHKDGIKEHNNIQNLEWVTYADNMVHSYKTGLRNSWGIEKMGYVNSKKVRCIETGIVYESGKAAAEAMGLDPSHISKVCRGKLKTTGGYHFEFAIKEEISMKKIEAITNKFPEDVKNDTLLTAAETCYDEGIITYEEFNYVMKYLDEVNK